MTIVTAPMLESRFEAGEALKCVSQWASRDEEAQPGSGGSRAG